MPDRCIRSIYVFFSPFVFIDYYLYRFKVALLFLMLMYALGKSQQIDFFT